MRITYVLSPACLDMYIVPFCLGHISYLYLCVTATLLNCCGLHPCGVHTDSIAAAVLLLQALSSYVEFTLDNGHQQNPLLTNEGILPVQPGSCHAQVEVGSVAQALGLLY